MHGAASNSWPSTARHRSSAAARKQSKAADDLAAAQNRIAAPKSIARAVRNKSALRRPSASSHSAARQKCCSISGARQNNGGDQNLADMAEFAASSSTVATASRHLSQARARHHSSGAGVTMIKSAGDSGGAPPSWREANESYGLASNVATRSSSGNSMSKT